MPRKRAAITWMAAGVAVVTVAVHWPCLANGFVNWDDYAYLDEVAKLKHISLGTIKWAFTALVPFYYHPLTWLSHVTDYQLWGMNPAGHHATNLVLHGLNSALVTIFSWMVLSIGSRSSVGVQLAMAAGAGLAFGIQPLQVESVAWVAERKNLLCGLFGLASLCAYLRWGQTTEDRRPWWWATVALFGAALLSKPMAVSLPVVMLILDFYPLHRHLHVGLPKLVREKLLLFAMAAVEGVLTFLGQAQVGAFKLIGLNLWERCLLAARGITFYLWKLLWPAWLSPFYPLGSEVSVRLKEFCVPVAVVVVVTAACVWTRRRAPAVLAAWVAFVVMIIPVSGLLQAGGQAVADRFAYLAMIAPLLVLAGAGGWLWQRARRAGRAALLTVIGCAFVFSAVRTREQIAVWKDDVTLWTAVIHYYPQSRFEYRYVTEALVDQQRWQEALPYASRAVEVLPDDALARALLARASGELAEVKARQSDFQSALPLARQAVELHPDNPRARALLGLVCLKTSRYEEALTELNEALRLDADLPAARYNLACAYSRLGRLAEAYGVLRELLLREPQYAQLAARDPELAGLRNDPQYTEQVGSLLAENRSN